MAHQPNEMESIRVAAGSVTGLDHIRAGRNNQDAWCVRKGDNAVALVVCDGCGSSPHAEAGAIVGARLVANALVRRARVDARCVLDAEASLGAVRDDVLAHLRILALGLGDDLAAEVHQSLLFTVVGAWLANDHLLTFSVGDGVVAVNGEVTEVGPFPGNQPPYLSYGLVGLPVEPAVHHRMPLSEVESVLLGSDGVLDLMAAEGEAIPGATEPVGPLSRLWASDVVFDNPDYLRRFLARCNRTGSRTVKGKRRRRAGILPDDTTVVVLRREREVGW